MSLLRQERVNALINIAAKVSVGLVPLVFVPIYVRSLGMHGYGVFAYALTLIGLSSIFDFGLSPALTRAFSQESNRPQRGSIFKTFEMTYLAVGLGLLVAGALVLAVVGASTAHFSVATSVWTWSATAALIACSWPVTLYSGALLGADHQIRLNVIMFTGALVRFVGGAALLRALGPNPVYLLLGQAAGFLVTALLLRRAVITRSLGGEPATYMPRVIRRNLGFATQTWIIVGIGVACGQLDKQVIATAFGLAVFSSYSIAWTLSAAASNIAHPIGSSYFPKSVAAFEAGNSAYLRKAVSESLSIITLLILAPCAVAATFARDLLALWLGSGEVAKVETFLVPLLYAAQLGAIGALTQTFLTSFGKVGVIVILNAVQLTVMAAGIFVTVVLRAGDASAIAYLWILVQGLGTMIGVYLVARAVDADAARLLLTVVAAISSVDVAAWAVYRLLSPFDASSLVRLASAGVACCAIAAMFVFAQRSTVISPGAAVTPESAAPLNNEGAEHF